MKLRDKEESLALSIVLSTLSQNGVNIKPLETGKHFILIKDSIIEAQAFDSVVGGLMIRRLADKFDINRLDFYYDPITGQSKRKRNSH